MDAAIAISIASPGFGIFTGVYFNNGLITEDGVPVETFDGTAWLRLDNQQPTPDFANASPNTRFMVKDLSPPTGQGTFSFLEVGGVVTYRIVKVDEFIRFNSCGAPIVGVPPSPCASITFRAENVNGPPCIVDDLANTNGGCHIGHAQAFDKSSCLKSDNEGGFYIDRSCVPSS